MCPVRICCFDFSVIVTVIFSKSEVCVTGTCSQFSIAGVLACLSLEATFKLSLDLIPSLPFPFARFCGLLEGEYVDVE